MSEHLSIEELRQLSARLRDHARSVDDLRIKRRMAEAALALAEIAEALNRKSAKS
ncbi:MAG TPA: hypothetical protein VEK14_00290 [Rhodomicrobium sp.]|nr:hypothetical protein [Rhodomicrobium sp.]